MTQAITRLYGSEAHASNTVKALKKAGFLSDQINHVTGADASGGGIAAAIEGGGVPKAHAAIYAEGVQRGGAVVSVRPPFGSAQRATEILESFEPIDAGLGAVAASPAKTAGGKVTRTPDILDLPPVKDDPTPLSSRLNIPVLLDDPTPFSTFWKWPVLSDKSAPLSEKFGIPVFSDSATPLSTWLNLPVFSASATPLSSWLNLPMFSNSATPLSSWLNLPMFSAPAAPAGMKRLETPAAAVAEPAPKKPARKAAEKAVEQAPDGV